MKLAELLQGPKPTPSPLPRGQRSTSEGKPSDFADALSEARRKPEPKPAAAEKPTPARKEDAAHQPTDEATTAEPSDVEERDPAVPTDEAPVEEESTPFAEDESDAPAEHEPSDAVPDLTGVALAQAGAPHTPAIADQQPADVDLETQPLPQVIRPPELNGTAQPTDAAADVAEEADAVGAAAADVSELLLEGLDEAGDAQAEEPFDELDLDAALSGDPVAKAPAKPHGSAAPVKPIEAADPTDGPTLKATDADDAKPMTPAANEFAMNADAAIGEEPVAPGAHVIPDSNASQTTTVTSHVQPEPAKPQVAAQAPVAQAPAPPPPPQQHFIEANHPKLVSAVQAQALTNGGSMQIRLDPPELGALQVMVHMQDGVMTASFQTSNDDATKLLSHSLSQLKQVLESQGVSVERLQVQQAPKDSHAQNDDPQQQNQRDQHADAHRQEQQRKEMLRRMWRRLSNGSDPLDLVA